VRPLFCHFTSNLQKIRPRIFSPADIFLGPLLRFAAEISAGWQHWGVDISQILFEKSQEDSYGTKEQELIPTVPHKKRAKKVHPFAAI
jgi:hypothetical protein